MPQSITESWRSGFGTSLPNATCQIHNMKFSVWPDVMSVERLISIGARSMFGETPEWAFWAMISLLAFVMILPALKR